MSKITGYKRLSSTLLALIGCLALSDANASLTYNYTGNPFDDSSNSSWVGNWLVASVTFSDPNITSGFSGDVYDSSVSQWSIEVSQVPSTRQDNTTNSWHSQWPLWFHLNNGVITGWQLLARPLGTQYPEIYTTSNSTYPSINPTADYYLANTTDYAANLRQPGIWAVASTPIPIPATTSLIGLALAGLAFVRRRHQVS